MLYMENILSAILDMEGQTLMGLSFLTDTLGLSLDKIDGIFKQTIAEYQMRRPVVREYIGRSGVPIAVPSNTISVRNVRFNAGANAFPRTVTRTFGQSAFDTKIDYDRTTGQKFVIVRTIPPIGDLRLMINQGYTVGNTLTVPEDMYAFESETHISKIINATPREGTLEIKGDTSNLTAIEVGRCIQEVTIDGVAQTTKVIQVDGSLGSGFVVLENRKLCFVRNRNISENIHIEYKPKYSYIVEMENSDYVFVKFFAVRILRALATLREHISQDKLQNIDLTTDDLVTRANRLEKEVNATLKKTFNWSALSNQ